MIEILIPIEENKLEPKGGPYGYCYNLREGLRKVDNGDIRINFLPASESSDKVYRSSFLRKFWTPRKVVQILAAKHKKGTTKYQGYDIIHFHTTLDMYLNQNSLKNTDAVVVVTSHSPEAWHREFITLKLKNKYRWLYKSIEAIDEYAFERADYVIFPCEYAEEPYFHTWEKYELIKNKKKEKYRYLLTGIKQCKAKIDRQAIRKKYQIPEDAKVLCYVGRHNEIKGYDLIQKAYREALKDKGYYVLVAGGESPIPGIQNDDHWIEVGWTKDPHSIINASDLFILPNRETYFDLIVLEVLSLGAPILMSNTGGNKHFLSYETKGIQHFESENIRDMVQKIDTFFSTVDDGVARKENLELFNSCFTDEKFAKSYLEIMNEIYEDRT